MHQINHQTAIIGQYRLSPTGLLQQLAEAAEELDLTTRGCYGKLPNCGHYIFLDPKLRFLAIKMNNLEINLIDLENLLIHSIQSDPFFKIILSGNKN